MYYADSDQESIDKENTYNKRRGFISFKFNFIHKISRRFLAIAFAAYLNRAVKRSRLRNYKVTLKNVEVQVPPFKWTQDK